VSKGYAEGPAAEEAERRREELGRSVEHEAEERPAVFGCTEAQPKRHFLGWVGEIDPKELFARGDAWGLKVVRIKADRPSPPG
jgi:hypothetical protein